MTNPVSAPRAEQAFLAWESRIKLLTNGHVWAMIALAFGIGAAALTILFAIASGSLSDALLMGAGILAFFLVIYLLIGIVVDLFGGFQVSFALTDRGVHSVQGKTSSNLSTVAVVGGALAGNMAATGAGLLAQSERHVFLSYPEVTKVKISSGGRYIVIRGGTFDKPIGLYCSPEQGKKALEILHYYCPAARFQGA